MSKFEPISIPPGSKINLGLNLSARRKYTVRFGDGSEVTMALDPGSVLSITAMQGVTIIIDDDDLGNVSPDRILH